MLKTDSAAPDDTEYLLHSLTVTPLRFRVKRGAAVPHSEPEAGIFAYLREHPGQTIISLQEHVPVLAGIDYYSVHAIMLRLLDKGQIEPDGQVSLEEVDTRYERVPTCDLCGASSEGHKIVLWKYNTPVVRCSGCGLLYANPRWKAEYLFGRYTPDYWALYTDVTSPEVTCFPSNDERWHLQLDYMERETKKGRLLDVGCATGEFMLAARARGWEVYGLEPSAEAAERAHRLTGAEVFCGTLDNAPYPQGHFDAVTMWDVIEHVQSPRDYLTRAAGLLRYDGLLGVTTPNIRSLSFKVQKRNWWVVGPNDHIYYFSPETIDRLLTICGYAARDIRSYGLDAETVKRLLPLESLRRMTPQLHKLVESRILCDELILVARKA